MAARLTIMLASVALLPFLPSVSTAADDAPPSFQADPGVYKLLFEDQNFRVIDAVRKHGELPSGTVDRLFSDRLPR
jgi:hypothetical protein